MEKPPYKKGSMILLKLTPAESNAIISVLIARFAVTYTVATNAVIGVIKLATKGIKL